LGTRDYPEGIKYLASSLKKIFLRPKANQKRYSANQKRYSTNQKMYRPIKKGIELIKILKQKKN
jgi:hypothetical protein